MKRKEYTAVKKDGSVVPVMVFSEPIIVDEEVAGLRGLIIDITDRKKVEVEMMQAQRLASIGQLSAGVAHEINNPLSALSGEIQWLLEKTKDKELRKSLKFMNGVSNRIAGIVKGLLMFSRSSMSTAKVSSDINSLIEQDLSLMKRRFKVFGIRINRRYSENLPKVNVNKGEIEQVFLNIMFNSFYAMRDGGKLIIETKKSKKPENIEIIFSDTGEGIAPENVSEIFVPFFTTKPIDKGTGLGLSISHGIIKNHGGNIEVKSEVNKGTKIYITLPVSGLRE
jgi:two-component system NtrC family sensor kinase